MLSSCANVTNYIDDVIIFGNTEIEHDKAVQLVSKIFRDNDVYLNEEKCVWKTQKLKFLVHVLSDRGIEIDSEKLHVISSFRDPKNKEELRSFLGLVTYVGKFIPHLAHHTDPLRQLLKKDRKFVWNTEEKLAFENLKLQLSEIQNLAYFDPKRRTRLIADASLVALGAELL